MEKDNIKKSVRERYASIPMSNNSCCELQASCCSGSEPSSNLSKSLGYSEEELQNIPDGANFGLGCGNPVALASIKEGETVIDLGSGAGIDCFLAAPRVGKKGRVIGVDMTPEMIEKARSNAAEGKYENIEFRLGEIENIPAANETADLVISNCVINLSPDKKQVFREAYRVLKTGGRMMISDIVLKDKLPYHVANSVEAYTGCIAGAMLKEDYISAVKAAGFGAVQVLKEQSFPIENCLNDPYTSELASNLKLSPEEMRQLGEIIISINLLAFKQ